MKKHFVVIGLGRFGGSICRELHSLGHQVLAIDIIPEKVNTMTDYSTSSTVTDATDKEALLALGIKNFDVAIVAIGENEHASIQSTLVLKEIGIKVWVKAQNTNHQKILEKIGADRVIHPELDMGIRIAHQLDSDNIIDFINLSKNYSIVELKATGKLSNRSLIDLNVRAKYGCTILAIKRGEDVNVSPSPNDIVHEEDILVVMGSNSELKHFEEKGM
ncbi:TrkA family potassium uptake protein [Filobacillus milosensis]|uniref:TrkA family potassium uptake protein n=1 Tax=Filobacillus milosensis TaxID=94137 RepID=A0A4Y8IF86_9BACI|nr:TrkA family potassium uptake protein [Filobacillus milosensis]TFB13797.1 TrkA family potassium uptake protein [Filobacillus milosensis]